MSYVARIKIDNDSELLVGSSLYGTCSTGSSTATKEVSISGFDQFITGVTVHIKFEHTNTASSPTLKINTMDAKPMHRVSGTAVGTTVTTSWVDGALISFTYDGTYWVMNTATDTDTNTTYTFVEGNTDGAFSYTPSDTNSAVTVPVHNVIKSTGDTMTGALTLSGAPTANLHAATKKYVDDAIGAATGATDAMVFKGTIGAVAANPTVTALPTTGYATGWTYRVVSAGTYSGHICEVGDLIIAVTNAPDTGNGSDDDWTVAQTNIDSSVYKGSNVFTDGYVILADGTAGQAKAEAKATSISVGDTSTALPTAAAVATFVTNRGYVNTSGVTSVAAGIGLATADGNAITTTGTIKVKLKSETALTADSTVATETTGRNYAVVTDHSEYLAVTVPWTDTQVTQTGIETNGEYSILLKHSTGTTDETDTVNFGKTSGKLITVNPSTGIISAAGFYGTFSGTLQASDIKTALGVDNTVTSDKIFFHKSGTWKVLAINNTTTTIASISGGVLTLKSTVNDSAALTMTDPPAAT